MKWIAGICAYRWILPLMMIAAATASAQPVSPIERPLSGVIAATASPVEVIYIPASGRSIGRQADTGDQIFLDDEVRTGAAGSMQVMLRDQTVFTMGPNSAIRFDRFVYDPETSEKGAVSASILGGSFKFISGQIADHNPDGMTIKLSNATAAIRGTTVAGQIHPDGTSSLVVLSGAVIVTPDHSNQGVEVFRSGWGVRIAEDGIPSDPVPFPEPEIRELVAMLALSDLKDEDENNPDKDPEKEDDASDDKNADGNPEPFEKEEDKNSEKSDDENHIPPIISSITASTQKELSELLVASLSDEKNIIALNDLVALLSGGKKLEELTDLEKEQLIPNINSNNGINIQAEADLINLALSGEPPIWMVYQNQPSDQLGNPVLDNMFKDLISESYGGQANFAIEGLALSPTAGQGSGSLTYNLVLDYDSLTIIGTYSVNELELGGTGYQDYSASFSEDLTTGQVRKVAAFDATGLPSQLEDENLNGLLDVGEETESLLLGAVDSISPIDTNAKTGAQVYLTGSFGSISDGESALDGNLADVQVIVRELDETGVPSFTGNNLRANHISAGQ
jgi:enamine deaminase RidA (YjgF/YER057c/UK114 family)